ncbi:MAG: PIN domain-containing protein [Actinomycetota bacterium]|nr:PIN domain-containing protein [Actinomycetota bacterium]
MIVVDSSAAVDALIGAPRTSELRARLSADRLHAPALLDYEVVSVLRGLTLGGGLGVARAQEALSDFDDLPIRRWPALGSLRRRAFQLRDNLSAYDAAYVALAEALGCPLVTRDVRLGRATGTNVRVEVH